jgi:hypothetical protein
VSFSSVFAFLKGNLNNVIIGLCITMTIGFYVALRIEQAGRENDRIESGNILAEHDRLAVVYKDSLGTVSGRYVFLEKKIEDTVQTLNAYIKKTKSEVLSLSTINSELRLENQTLQGRLGRDSVGEFASFDTSTVNYSIGLDVRLHPTPQMLLRSLVVPDNTTIGYLLQGSTIQGVVTHSNPLVRDIGGSFHYKIPQPQIADNTNYFPYILGGGVGVLVGYLLKSVVLK